MPDAEGALDRLTSPRPGCPAIISSTRTAWFIGWSMRASGGHAANRAGAAIADVNSASVGIEIVDPGHQSGYRPFPVSRLACCRGRLADIEGRAREWAAECRRPFRCRAARKDGPRRTVPVVGARQRRLALPAPSRAFHWFWTDQFCLLALERFGYDVTDNLKAVIAFPAPLPPRPTVSTASPSTASVCAKLLALLLRDRR